jgi:hypothetical protein
MKKEFKDDPEFWSLILIAVFIGTFFGIMLSKNGVCIVSI